MPLFKEGLVDSQLLCECSRCFASKMFESVVGHPVEATIVRAIIRGSASCVYRVQY